jgi:hypothetical protein
MHRKYDEKHNEQSCTDPGGEPTVAELQSLREGVAELKVSVQSLEKDMAELKSRVVDPSGGKPQTSPGGTPAPVDPSKPVTGTEDTQPLPGSDVTLAPGQKVTVAAR